MQEEGSLVCTSETGSPRVFFARWGWRARKIRVPLARARGGASQEGLVSALHAVACLIIGRALREGTAR